MWERRATVRARFRCLPPFSFYHDLISAYWAGGPDEVASGPLHRICTLARKMGVGSVLVEDALDRPAIQEELAGLEAAAPGQEGVATAIAITFMYPRPHGAARRAAATFTDGILGQALVVTYPVKDGARSYVFEAALRIPHEPGAFRAPLLNNYFSLTSGIEIEAAGEKAMIPGTYFCQQNGTTTVCAHSVLRGVHHCITGGSVSSARLNALLGLVQPAPEVTDRQLGAALEKLGCRLQVFEFQSAGKGRADDAAWGVLCTLIESGLPAILVLSMPGRLDHVVSLIGHTLNTDEWQPVASQLYSAGAAATRSSSAWVDHLVAHDDLFGPYYCISRSALLQGGSPSPGPAPRLVMGVLPADVEISAYESQQLGSEALKSLIPDLARAKFGKGRWWDYLAKPDRQKVLRTTLVDRPAYVDHLTAIFRGSPEDAKPLALFIATLPVRFWVCEVSLPQLFVGNRTKLGEVLLRTAGDSRNWEDCILGLRLPSILLWRTDGSDSAVADVAVDSHDPILAPRRHLVGW